MANQKRRACQLPMLDLATGSGATAAPECIGLPRLLVLAFAVLGHISKTIDLIRNTRAQAQSIFVSTRIRHDGLQDQ